MWNSPVGTRVSEDRGGEGATGAGVEISLQAVKAVVAQAAQEVAQEDHDRADIHTAAVEDPMLEPRHVP